MPIIQEPGIGEFISGRSESDIPEEILVWVIVRSDTCGEREEVCIWGKRNQERGKVDILRMEKVNPQWIAVLRVDRWRNRQGLRLELIFPTNFPPNLLTPTSTVKKLIPTVPYLCEYRPVPSSAWRTYRVNLLQRVNQGNLSKLCSLQRGNDLFWYLHSSRGSVRNIRVGSPLPFRYLWARSSFEQGKQNKQNIEM